MREYLNDTTGGMFIFIILINLIESKVKTVILFDGNPTDSEFIEKDKINEKCCYTHTYTGIEQSGLAAIKAAAKGDTTLPPWPDNTVKPDDLDTVVFTSGTTGRPKGAMISHMNLIGMSFFYLIFFFLFIIISILIMVVVAGGYCLHDRRCPFPPPPYQDSLVSYLPLAHIFQRSNEMYCLCDVCYMYALLTCYFFILFVF
jgi:long-subunit acyl-CoA synthetase (AMP-forming)